MGERAFIITQSIKKLPAEDKAWALNQSGFRRMSDHKLVNISEISDDDTDLYYKEEPYTPKKLHQRLIVTYSPKYARYQKTIRDAQIERAGKMIQSGNTKKQRKLDYKYTCEEILDTLKAINFAGIQKQGFIPIYKRLKITDDLHDICGFRTDYQFITKSQMKTIQKKRKGIKYHSPKQRKKSLYPAYLLGLQRFPFFQTVKDRIICRLYLFVNSSTAIIFHVFPCPPRPE